MHIEYQGSTAILFEDRVYSYHREGKGGVLPKFAREMISKGMNPEEIVHVFRGGTRCFKPLPLRVWAKVSVWERDAGSVILSGYVPRYA